MTAAAPPAATAGATPAAATATDPTAGAADVPGVRPFRVGITEEEIAEFTELASAVLRSGQLILGEQTEAFEAEFAAVAGVRHAVAVATGTVALEILHRATNANATNAAGANATGAAGRTALVPANTNYATAAAAQHAGARVRLYDAGLYARVDAVQDALDQYPDTHSVTVVHIGGYVSPDLDRIRVACAERGVLLIEDAAHAHGASHHGRPAGSLADAGAFSFYPTKVLTTGEGGMITTDRATLAAAARTYRDQGKDATGDWHVAAGSSWRMPELSAALGRVLLRRLPATLARTRAVAATYTAALTAPGALAGTGGLTVPDLDPATLSGHKYIALAADSEHRARLVAAAAASGVRLARGVYEQPLHRQPLLTDTADLAGGRRYPRADGFADRHLCLPLWRAITDQDVAHTLAALGVADAAGSTR